MLSKFGIFCVSLGSLIPTPSFPAGFSVPHSLLLFAFLGNRIHAARCEQGHRGFSDWHFGSWLVFIHELQSYMIFARHLLLTKSPWPWFCRAVCDPAGCMLMVTSLNELVAAGFHCNPSSMLPCSCASVTRHNWWRSRSEGTDWSSSCRSELSRLSLVRVSGSDFCMTGCCCHRPDTQKRKAKKWKALEGLRGRSWFCGKGQSAFLQVSL